MGLGADGPIFGGYPRKKNKQGREGGNNWRNGHQKFPGIEKDHNSLQRPRRSILGLMTGELTGAGVSGPLKPGERVEDPAQALLMRYKLNYAEIEKQILYGQHRVLGISLAMRFSERGAYWACLRLHVWSLASPRSVKMKFGWAWVGVCTMGWCQWFHIVFRLLGASWFSSFHWWEAQGISIGNLETAIFCRSFWVPKWSMVSYPQIPVSVVAAKDTTPA